MFTPAAWPSAALRARVLLPLLLAAWHSTAAAVSGREQRPILVVGSVNLDTTIAIDRLPARGECIAAAKPSATRAVGGKGANQAVAAARLRSPGAPPPNFAARFGGDADGAWMRSELESEGLELSGSKTIPDLASGAGIVWLDSEGAATSVVLGGANELGWGLGGNRGSGAGSGKAGKDDSGVGALQAAVAEVFKQSPPGALMLQREIPEAVNEAYATAAAAAGVPVILDAGGADAPLPKILLTAADYIAPNQIELGRLTGLPVGTVREARTAARALLSAGARRVLVTLGDAGAMLLQRRNGGEDDIEEVRQAPFPVPGGIVLDATAAGDAFRAAFATAIVEDAPTRSALRFAAAAGAVAVARAGAMPSLPSRAEVEDLLQAHPPGNWEESLPGDGEGESSSSSSGTEVVATGADQNARGRHKGGTAGSCPAAGGRGGTCGAGDQAPPAGAGCPLKFAARLNSMRARRDLVEGSETDPAASDTTLGWIARQRHVRGLGLVYFNYPQQLEGLASWEVLSALSAAGLQAGGVALRFPESRFRGGAFTSPDADTRRAAVTLAADACRWAESLGAQDVVVWSAYDGYDYPLQADYETAWESMVEGFTALADACPTARVSLEWKPTDPASRFSFVPSTGAALLLAQQVNRSNFGITLDTGHALMAGESAAQSAALLAGAGKLFGVHLNDGHSRIGAEDGLIFGSVHYSAALELVYWLRRVGYSGSVYFDTFPLNEDPVREAEANIDAFKALWARAAALEEAGLEGLMERRDALGVLSALRDLEGGCS